MYPYKFNCILGLLLHNISKPEAKYYLNTKNNIAVSLEKKQTILFFVQIILVFNNL